MTHDELINALGGTAAVSKLTGRDKSTVSLWRERGISWMCRPIVAHEAGKHKIELPEGFLEPIPHLGKVS